MNLDDLMTVWRSQDAAPIHGVNETLLRLALRQGEVRVRKQRRRNNLIAGLSMAFLVVILGLFLATMIDPYDDDVLSSWEYAIPVVGMAAAVLWVCGTYVKQRTQVAREQRFGESLRDQISRQIAQIDYGISEIGLAKVLKNTLLPMVGAVALILTSWRVNDRQFNDANLWLPVGFMIVWFVLNVSAASWWQRRALRRELLPRKQRLEGLLRELEG